MVLDGSLGLHRAIYDIVDALCAHGIDVIESSDETVILILSGCHDVAGVEEDGNFFTDLHKAQICISPFFAYLNRYVILGKHELNILFTSFYGWQDYCYAGMLNKFTFLHLSNYRVYATAWQEILFVFFHLFQSHSDIFGGQEFVWKL
ncbi:hypothetical protein ACJX0J_036463 [Zea mays]